MTTERKPTDLETFKAMLERAGVENVDERPGMIILHDQPVEEQDSYCWADTTFEFNDDGSLKSVTLEGS